MQYSNCGPTKTLHLVQGPERAARSRGVFRFTKFGAHSVRQSAGKQKVKNHISLIGTCTCEIRKSFASVRRSRGRGGRRWQAHDERRTATRNSYVVHVLMQELNEARSINRRTAVKTKISLCGCPGGGQRAVAAPRAPPGPVRPRRRTTISHHTVESQLKKQRQSKCSDLCGHRASANLLQICKFNNLITILMTQTREHASEHPCISLTDRSARGPLR